MAMTPERAQEVGKYYLESLTSAHAVSALGAPPQEFTPPTAIEVLHLPGPRTLPEDMQKKVDHLFGLIWGKVKPEIDADWDIVEEYDEKIRAITPKALPLTVRHRPEKVPSENLEWMSTPQRLAQKTWRSSIHRNSRPSEGP